MGLTFPIVATLSLIAGFLLGARHDYIAYQWHWRDIAAGGDPWINAKGEWTTNAYGPLHAVFAPLYAIHPLLPKLVFICCWLGIAWFYLRRSNDRSRVWLYAFLLFNPFFLVEFVSWGHHEVVLAALILFATVSALRDKWRASGALIGLGVLLKFIPVFLIPLFWIKPKSSPREWRHGFLLASCLVISIGFILSCIIWGKTTFYPLMFSVQREATLLSVFRMMKDMIPLESVWLMSKALICASSLVVFVWYWMGKSPLLHAIVAELLIVFVLYPVGHQQFHNSVLLLIPLLGFVTWQLRMYAGFLIAYEVAFVSFGQYSGTTERISTYGSIPFLIIGLWSALSLLTGNREARNGRAGGI